MYLPLMAFMEDRDSIYTRNEGAIFLSLEIEFLFFI